MPESIPEIIEGKGVEKDWTKVCGTGKKMWPRLEARVQPEIKISNRYGDIENEDDEDDLLYLRRST